MKTVVEIDLEIERVKKTGQKLEADKQKNIALLATAKGTREKNALAALSSDDNKAQDKLQKARSSQRELELLIEDAAFAIAAINEQLEQLYAAREESYRHERWLEFQAASKTAIDQAHFLDGSFTALRQLLVEHNSTLRTLTALAVESGRPTTNFRLRHVLRFMESALNRVLPFEYAKLPEPYRNGSYDEFLTEQIDSVGNRAGAAQTEEVKQTA